MFGSVYAKGGHIDDNKDDKVGVGNRVLVGLRAGTGGT